MANDNRTVSAATFDEYAPGALDAMLAAVDLTRSDLPVGLQVNGTEVTVTD